MHFVNNLGEHDSADKLTLSYYFFFLHILMSIEYFFPIKDFDNKNARILIIKTRFNSIAQATLMYIIN